MKITKQELRKLINGIIKLDYDNNKKDMFKLQMDLVDGDIVPTVMDICYKKFMELCGDKLFSIFELLLNKYLSETYNTSYQLLRLTRQSIRNNFEGTLYDMISNRYIKKG